MANSETPLYLNDSDIIPKLEHLALENLSLKIAETAEEIEQAQRLRYEVFYKEMGAVPTGDMGGNGIEIEKFDPYCIHLLVVDSSMPQGSQIVGTYRILTQETVDRHGITFYTETEFDLGKLRAKGGKIMEVSRSCVLESHRSKLAINLLWKGIAAFVFANKVDYLIGTPSMQGTDLAEHAETLAYLNAFHLADEDIRPRALPEHYNALPVVPKESINVRKAFMDLPPLVKGYMRMGAMISDGVYVDHQFNCVDIAIVVAIDKVEDKYFNHFKRADVE